MHFNIILAIVGFTFCSLTFAASTPPGQSSTSSPSPTSSSSQITPEIIHYFSKTYGISPRFWRLPLAKQLHHSGWRNFCYRVFRHRLTITDDDQRWLANYWADQVIAEVQNEKSPLYQQIIAEKVTPQFQRDLKDGVAVRLTVNPHFASDQRGPLAVFLAEVNQKFGDQIVFLFDPFVMWSTGMGANLHERLIPQNEICFGEQCLRDILAARVPEGILFNEIIFHEMFHAQANLVSLQHHAPGYLEATVIPQNEAARAFPQGGYFSVEEIGAYLHGLWANIQFLKIHYTEHHYLAQESIPRMIQREKFLFRKVNANLAEVLTFSRITRHLISGALAKMEENIASVQAGKSIPYQNSMFPITENNKMALPVTLPPSNAVIPPPPAAEAPKFTYMLPLTLLNEVVLAGEEAVFTAKELTDLNAQHQYLQRLEVFQQVSTFLRQQAAYLQEIENKLQEFGEVWKKLSLKIKLVVASAEDYDRLLDILAAIPSPYPWEKTSLFTSAATPQLSLTPPPPAQEADTALAKTSPLANCTKLLTRTAWKTSLNNGRRAMFFIDDLSDYLSVKYYFWKYGITRN